MAKCYVLSADQAARWDAGGFDAWHVEDELIEYCDANNIREPVVFILPGTHRIAFALTEKGHRA